MDEFSSRNLLAFGPNRLAAELEGSKVFSKLFMKKYGIRTPDAEVCQTRAEAEKALRSYGLPCVFKADGLAGGKGVVVAQEPEEADRALKLFFEDRVFGSAGDRVLVERFVSGNEVSFMVLCDGERALPLATAMDYKKIFDGDRGPNTGGMGAHSPSVLLDASSSSDVLAFVVQPTLKGMADEGRPFRGVLFVGLILEEGLNPYVLEYNVRFGDPETQAVLLRLDGDLLPFLMGSARGRFDEGAQLAWRREATACSRDDRRGLSRPVREGASDHRSRGRRGDGRRLRLSCGDGARRGRRPRDVGRQGPQRLCARAAVCRRRSRTAKDAAKKIHFEGAHYRQDIGHTAMEILMERSGSMLR